MSQRGQDSREETKGTSMKGCSVVQDDADGLQAKFQNFDRTAFGRRWATDLVRSGIVDIDLMGWD
jgi:hypothetical protein